MRILYDGKIYEMQSTGGVNRYFANLISRLPEDIQPTLTTSALRDIHKPTHSNLKTVYYKRFAFRPGRVSHWLEKYYFRLMQTARKFDLAHPTYYTLLTEQNIRNYKMPVVLTVHDMIHEIFYPDYPEVAAKRNAIEAAQAIICVSENTKNDLLNRFSIPESSVQVIYLASEIDINLSYGEEPVPDCPYFLYVGHRDFYKNFDGLLKAFTQAASMNSEIALAVVGFPFNDQEQKLLAELGISNRVLQYSSITDNHLAKLYRCSTAFVYPSHYEGFGIPPLEAMACGTAVVASDSSSIPEVIGDAGLLFNSKVTDDLTDLLLCLLNHPAEREHWVEKGRQRAKTFSWDKTTAQTLEVYRSVLS